ncbi:restriction endonuclease subunit S [Archangium violaceum]|uniref:restriction endonuclease subunit S n=1 Tax=Archangium violaceum TaxID=83451 RepID=UPI00193B1671|nr:restriction endonuclease subunit S [Archangium violaceum]QRK12307.1 restriction endonuclease subunit S [Archangium violaceum]
MTAREPSRLVPRLRFPEFECQRGWPLTTLGAVLDEHGLKSDGTSDVHSVSLAKGIVPQVEHMGRSFAASDTGHYSLVRPFDVVYTRSPLAMFKLGIVKQHRRDYNAIVSPLYGVFAPKNRHVGLLVEAFFESPARAFRYLDPLAQKGAKNTIQLSNERFLSGSLYLPEDEDEQQKVAECLGSLDELIAAEGRKLEALRRHKRGLMQELFPQAGEPRPRLRFPKFSDPWEGTTLGKQCDSISSGKDKSDPDGQFDLYGSTGVIGKTHHATFTDTALLVARVGANAGFLTKAEGEFGVTDNTLVINLKDRDNVDFFLYYLENFGLNKMIYGSGQPLITGGQLKALTLWVPEKKERERIAGCLSVLGASIAGQSRKVDALKRHKQGLLQQLFPRLEGEGQ